MMKSLKAMLRQDKEAYKVPKSVHDYIPITGIYEDGIFKVGNRFTKSFRFDDINYLVASKEDKETMFLAYSELLNSLDSGATTKITINNHKLNRNDFEKNILMPERDDEILRKRERISLASAQILLLTSTRLVQNARIWTLPKDCVSFTTSTVPDRKCTSGSI